MRHETFDPHDDYDPGHGVHILEVGTTLVLQATSTVVSTIQRARERARDFADQISAAVGPR
jgi:3-keto-L-gulonate-6-phosphate decarboxylase